MHYGFPIYLWRELLKRKYGFNKNMLINPFKFFRKKILTDPTLNKSLRLSKSKFFPFIIVVPVPFSVSGLEEL